MPAVTSAPAQPSPQTAARPNVLVVDDVKSTRDRLSRVLGSRGYGVLEATDGRDALKALATTPSIDAILLDLVMPAMNGWEFREFQLRDPRLAHIPTLVITVRDLAEWERYALRIGTATLIHKPFEDWQILESLARVLKPAQSPEQPPRWLSREGKPLLWSRRGQVACEQHAPLRDSEEWRGEGWTWIPDFAGKNKIEYCCQLCDGGPIRHGRARVVQAQT